jgi:hypothetical protein
MRYLGNTWYRHIFSVEYKRKRFLETAVESEWMLCLNGCGGDFSSDLSNSTHYQILGQAS